MERPTKQCHFLWFTETKIQQWLLQAALYNQDCCLFIVSDVFVLAYEGIMFRFGGKHIKQLFSKISKHYLANVVS